MIDYLTNWLADIQRNYGVNPTIFAVIYFAGIIPFWLSLYKIIAGLKNRNLKQVRTFSVVLGIIIISPFTYVALFGRNLPFWFWIIAVCVIGYSIYSVIRKIRTAKNIEQ
ncbi:MAG: hypothetical protein JSV97_01945 [candidate division WOR-3 bacterium]|nr:MAG: hypothetical protein JSV97_01945 [candidate division WOR-3 bacterium]